jgi:hypothetical protein
LACAVGILLRGNEWDDEKGGVRGGTRSRMFRAYFDIFAVTVLLYYDSGITACPSLGSDGILFAQILSFPMFYPSFSMRSVLFHSRLLTPMYLCRQVGRKLGSFLLVWISICPPVNDPPFILALTRSSGEQCLEILGNSVSMR